MINRDVAFAMWYGNDDALIDWLLEKGLATDEIDEVAEFAKGFPSQEDKLEETTKRYIIAATYLSYFDMDDKPILKWLENFGISSDEHEAIAAEARRELSVSLPSQKGQQIREAMQADRPS